MLDGRRLRVLVEVAERGSFSAAAEALSFTQPSVSRQIAALEREAGARLLERGARGVRLTQAGELVVAHARAVLDRLAVAETELRALLELEGGRLRMGAFPSANTWLVPEALRSFAQHHPRVELSLAGSSSEHHVGELQRGELELALITEWDVPDPARLEGVEMVTLLDDRMFVALGPSHRLARQPELSLDDLVSETWIEGAHPDCLGPLPQHYGARGFAPRIGFHCEEWTGKQALVASGMGIALFPGLALSSVRDDLLLRSLRDVPLSRRIYVAFRGGGEQTPAIAEMLTLLRAAAARHQQRLVARRLPAAVE